MPIHKKGMRLDMPASYRIAIHGHLDGSWSDRLAGMHISTCQGENQAPVATLGDTAVGYYQRAAAG